MTGIAQTWSVTNSRSDLPGIAPVIALEQRRVFRDVGSSYRGAYLKEKRELGLIMTRRKGEAAEGSARIALPLILVLVTLRSALDSSLPKYHRYVRYRPTVVSSRAKHLRHAVLLLSFVDASWKPGGKIKTLHHQY